MSTRAWCDTREIALISRVSPPISRVSHPSVSYPIRSDTQEVGCDTRDRRCDTREIGCDTLGCDTRDRRCDTREIGCGILGCDALGCGTAGLGHQHVIETLMEFEYAKPPQKRTTLELELNYIKKTINHLHCPWKQKYPADLIRNLL